MKKDVYQQGAPGEKYGIWNVQERCWQFSICEDTPMLAVARLCQKIGEKAHRWKFEPRPLPKNMRRSENE